MNKLDEIRMDWLKRIYESSKVGEEVYQLLTKKAGRGIGVIYSPSNVEDIFWLTALAEEYKKRYKYKHLLFTARERQADVLARFPGIDGTIPLNDDLNLCLRYYIMVQRLYYANDIRYGHFLTDLTWEPPYFIHCLPCESSRLKHMWDTVLGLPYNTKKSTPAIDKIADDVKGNLRKAILMMLGSFTIRGIPAVLWRKLAYELQKRGYEVYTNYSGLPYDIMLENTNKLETSLREIAAVSLYFKSIIGIRSGICDLLSMTGCSLNVLYLSQDAAWANAEIKKGILINGLNQGVSV